MCAVLFAVGKGAHALEACPAGEIQQLLEGFVVLARMSDHESGADMYARHFLAESLDEGVGLLAGDMAPHGCQHGVGDVLEGDVEVAADVLVAVDDGQEFPGEVGRIGIVETNPAYAGDVCHAVDELCDGATVVEVHAVVGELLRDDVKLLDADSHELAHFLEDVLNGAAAVATCDEGDGAVGAAAVAAFGDLDVGIVGGRGDDAAGGEVVVPGVAEVRKETGPVELAIPAVDLGYFGLKLSEITLGKAAHDIEAAEGEDAGARKRLTRPGGGGGGGRGRTR